MSANYYVLHIICSSPCIKGPLLEADARAECERIAQNGDIACLMQRVAECKPQQRQVTWREESKA